MPSTVKQQNGEDTEIVKQTFTVDIKALKQKPDQKLSEMFSKIDKQFLNSFSDRKDMLKTYRDIPIALKKLYCEEHTDYIKNRHGSDLQITIEGAAFGIPSNIPNEAKSALEMQQRLHQNFQSTGQKRRRRQVTLVKDSFNAEEEQVFERLHQAFTELQEEYGGKTIFEITDIFMKVSGDLDSLRAYLKQEKEEKVRRAKDGDDAAPQLSSTAEWNYIEDMALSMPESSTEYRDLLVRKGRAEIEKRKLFLLGYQGLHMQQTAAVAQNSMVTHPQQSQNQMLSQAAVGTGAPQALVNKTEPTKQEKMETDQ